MSEVDMTFEATVHLTEREFKLVGLALAGMLGSAELYEAAEALNADLLRQRQAALREMSTKCAVALEHAEGGQAALRRDVAHARAQEEAL